MNTKRIKQLLVLCADGTRHSHTFAGSDPDLATLQGYVGGYIQQVPHRFKLNNKPAIMYVDEDGLAKGLPYNEQATMLTGGTHMLVGPAVLVQE
jgi:hypothetical protein